MAIRHHQSTDGPEWSRMRRALWPDANPDELAAEAAEFAASGHIVVAQSAAAGAPSMAVFVAERPGGGLGGFVEVGTRSVADGATTSPVGYIEGWYVDPDLRRTGVGAALIVRAEEWAREQGCSEMGSDTELDNYTSQAAHKALGYAETDRLVLFLKQLP